MTTHSRLQTGLALLLGLTGLLGLLACNTTLRVIDDNPQDTRPDDADSGADEGGSGGTTGGNTGPDGGFGNVGGSGSGGSGGSQSGGPSSPCQRSGLCAALRSEGTDKVDILFMVDNSNSMAQEQASLRRELPRLIQVLTTGDLDGDGQQDFSAASSLHLGVVTSDLGLPSVSGIMGCEGLGDEALLNGRANPELMGCSASNYTPPFVSYSAERADDPAQAATDFACVATVGTEGCGFEQQLESALKAVWPQEDNRVAFLPDSVGFGEYGQGGTGPNAGFLRSDSLIGVVLVTDEDDCSSASVEHFRPATDPLLPADSPLRAQGLNTRCFHESQRPNSSLYSVDRYINAFKALRPDREEDVVFSAIVGVPPELVSPERMSEYDFSRDADVDSFYEDLLSAPAMQNVIDTRGTENPLDDAMTTSCDRGDDARAYPPRRIVEVARGFGRNGVVQSICQDDFGPAMEAIIERLAARLGPSCLPERLRRGSNGKVACDVIWRLSGASADSGLRRCSDRDFLSEHPSRPGDDSVYCKVHQVAGTGGTIDESEQGFYYDDFSPDVMQECAGSTVARIAFTAGAQPQAGVAAYLDCD